MRGLIAKQALGRSDFNQRMTDISRAKVSKGERSIMSFGRAFCQQIPDLFKWSDQLCPITHSHVPDLMVCVCSLRCRTKQIDLHGSSHVTEVPTLLSIPTNDRQDRLQSALQPLRDNGRICVILIPPWAKRMDITQTDRTLPIGLPKYIGVAGDFDEDVANFRRENHVRIASGIDRRDERGDLSKVGGVAANDVSPEKV